MYLHQVFLCSRVGRTKTKRRYYLNMYTARNMINQTGKTDRTNGTHQRDAGGAERGVQEVSPRPLANNEMEECFSSWNTEVGV